MQTMVQETTHAIETTKKNEATKIEINGVTYVREDSIPAARPNGNRAIIVVSHGWIYAGDVTEENGRIIINRAVWVFKWSGCGFSKVVEDPSNADIRPMTQAVDIPSRSEVYRIPVNDQWGL